MTPKVAAHPPGANIASAPCRNIRNRAPDTVRQFAVRRFGSDLSAQTDTSAHPNRKC
jgi:hypothetical protein